MLWEGAELSLASQKLQRPVPARGEVVPFPLEQGPMSAAGRLSHVPAGREQVRTEDEEGSAESWP